MRVFEGVPDDYNLGFIGGGAVTPRFPGFDDGGILLGPSGPPVYQSDTPVLLGPPVQYDMGGFILPKAKLNPQVVIDGRIDVTLPPTEKQPPTVIATSTASQPSAAGTLFGFSMQQVLLGALLVGGLMLLKK